MGVFLPTFHPLVPLTYWAPLEPLPKLGNIRTGDISRIFPVTSVGRNWLPHRIIKKRNEINHSGALNLIGTAIVLYLYSLHSKFCTCLKYAIRMNNNRYTFLGFLFFNG